MNRQLTLVTCLVLATCTLLPVVVASPGQPAPTVPASGETWQLQTDWFDDGHPPGASDSSDDWQSDRGPDDSGDDSGAGVSEDDDEESAAKDREDSDDQDADWAPAQDEEWTDGVDSTDGWPDHPVRDRGDGDGQTDDGDDGDGDDGDDGDEDQWDDESVQDWFEGISGDEQDRDETGSDETAGEDSGADDEAENDEVEGDDAEADDGAEGDEGPDEDSGATDGDTGDTSVGNQDQADSDDGDSSATGPESGQSDSNDTNEDGTEQAQTESEAGDVADEESDADTDSTPADPSQPVNQGDDEGDDHESDDHEGDDWSASVDSTALESTESETATPNSTEVPTPVPNLTETPFRSATAATPTAAPRPTETEGEATPGPRGSNELSVTDVRVERASVQSTLSAAVAPDGDGGHWMSVTATVQNPTNRALTATIELRQRGDRLGTQHVELQPSERQTVEWIRRLGRSNDVEDVTVTASRGSGGTPAPQPESRIPGSIVPLVVAGLGLLGLVGWRIHE